MDLTALGTFLAGIAALILGLIAVGLLAYDVRIRRHQLDESRARAEAALNVSVAWKIIPYPSVDASAGGRSILEVRVELTNAGREIVCVPAVYVSFKPLVDVTGKAQLANRYEWRFDQLEPLDTESTVSKVANIARLPRSIIQVAPDETENLVRWDILTDDIATRYPVIVVNVEVFSASSLLLGMRALKDGPLRMEWLKYMNGEAPKFNDMQRHECIVFDRAERDSPNGTYTAGQRILTLPPDGVASRESSGETSASPTKQPDEDNTAKFLLVLRSVVAWSRTETVVLGTTARSTPTEPV